MASVSCEIKKDNSSGIVPTSAPFDKNEERNKLELSNPSMSKLAENTSNDASSISSSGVTYQSPESTDPAVDERMLTTRRLICSLSKSQLIDLIVSASLQVPSIVDSAVKLVNESPVSRRLMIRNISFSSTDGEFVELFSSFGETDDIAIVRDKDGRSRGYGFVTYRKAESAARVLNTPLTLGNRPLLCKLAGEPYHSDFYVHPTTAYVPPWEVAYLRRKLFVRNLSDNVDNDSLHEAFSQFGQIEECSVICDQEGKSRGYAFVTFKSHDSALKAVQQPQKLLGGRVAFVAFAAPSQKKNIGGGYHPYTYYNGFPAASTGGPGTPGSGPADFTPRLPSQSQAWDDASNMAYTYSYNIRSPTTPTVPNYPHVFPYYGNPYSPSNAYGGTPAYTVTLPYIGNFEPSGDYSYNQPVVRP